MVPDPVEDRGPERDKLFRQVLVMWTWQAEVATTRTITESLLSVFGTILQCPKSLHYHYHCNTAVSPSVLEKTPPTMPASLLSLVKSPTVV